MLEILCALLESPKPVNFSGRFYKVSKLQLQPSIPSSLFPEWRDLNAIGLQMLRPEFEQGLSDARAIHFGITTRKEEAQATMQVLIARLRCGCSDCPTRVKAKTSASRPTEGLWFDCRFTKRLDKLGEAPHDT